VRRRARVPLIGDAPTPALLSDEQIAEIKADIEAGPYQYCTLKNANRLLDHALAASAALARVTAHRDRVRDEYDKALALCEADLRKCDATIARQAAEIAALKGTLHEYRASLAAIGLHARSDGNRTFDDAIRDLDWIDDECRRAALGNAEAGE
jgi:hypothetical protein